MSTLERADVVVVGPAPPLRGGIAQHTARLVEALGRSGIAAAAASYSRLYPAAFFPGRSQVEGSVAPPWAPALLDVAGPLSWLGLARRLAASRATVVLQWWHPVTAPALVAATLGVDRRRLVAVCHNALPHEAVPGAAVAARSVLSRCGGVVVHGEAEAGRVRDLLGSSSPPSLFVPLPALLAPPSAGREVCRRLARRLAGSDQGPVVVVAGHVRAYKGLASILAAWRLAQRPPAARLLVAGESYLAGRERREFSRLAQEDPTIVVVDRYLGDEEFVSLLAGADVVVAAWTRATQSGPVAIAGTLGVPCIVSDAGSLPGQAYRAASACRVIPAGDVGALAAALADATASGRCDGDRDEDSATARSRFEREWLAVVEAITGPWRR